MYHSGRVYKKYRSLNVYENLCTTECESNSVFWASCWLPWIVGRSGGEFLLLVAPSLHDFASLFSSRCAYQTCRWPCRSDKFLCRETLDNPYFVWCFCVLNSGKLYRLLDCQECKGKEAMSPKKQHVSIGEFSSSLRFHQPVSYFHILRVARNSVVLYHILVEARAILSKQSNNQRELQISTAGAYR